MALIDRVAKSSLNAQYGSSGQPSEVFVIPGAVQDIPKPNPFGEIGVSGVLRTRGVGIIYEEWLLDLATYRQKQIYREMRDNDAVIGALFFAIEMILRKAEWHVEQADGDKGGKYAQFIEECMQDMSHSWEDFIAEIVNMFAFGFGLFETVCKRRLGPDGRSASKYKDGLIGWRKFAPRAQESILYWIWDDEGGLQGAVQLAAPDYHTVPISIEKMLLFRTTSIKNNPEGRPCEIHTPVPTPYGWSTMEQVRVGDEVLDECGQVRKVTGKSKIYRNRPVYEIEFFSGGTVVADACHLWNVTTGNDRFNNRSAREMTTEAICLAMQKTTPQHFSCGDAPVLDLPEVDLLVDPYFLGYWLGNGTKNKTVVTCHEEDANEVALHIEESGYTTNIRENKTEEQRGDIAVFSKDKWASDGLLSSLRDLDLLDNKHIPPEYLRASANQRLALLQGLMDSDGHSSQRDGDCCFANSDLNLINQVAELVRTLGGQPRIGLLEKAGSLGGFVKGKQIIARQDSWRVMFTLGLPVHRLERKLINQNISRTSRTAGHFIKSVVRVENADTVCIEVDSPSHLFLVGKCMVPTHNSLLRNVYRSWFFKRRIEEVEGIGIERDLCGIPVLYCTSEALEAMGGQAEAIKLVTNIRIDDQAGVVLPLAYDEKGNPLVKLELLKAAGSKQTDAGATIGRYNSDILNTVLAGFVQFGQGPTGSRALHMSATQIFSLAITAFMDGVAGVMNRIAIPRLMKLNKFPQELSPKLVPGEIGVRDLDELSTYIQQLSQSGLTFFDPATQDYIRKIARLPATPKDDEGQPLSAQGQDPNNSGATDPQALLQQVQTNLQNGTMKFQDIQRMLNSITHPPAAKPNGVPQPTA